MNKCITKNILSEHNQPAETVAQLWSLMPAFLAESTERHTLANWKNPPLLPESSPAFLSGCWMTAEVCLCRLTTAPDLSGRAAPLQYVKKQPHIAIKRVKEPLLELFFRVKKLIIQRYKLHVHAFNTRILH